MYQSSANLTRWICDRHSIPKDRAHIIGHAEVPDPNNPGQYGGVSHHTDPGSGWDWSKYMGLVTGSGTQATGKLKGVVADATGNNYDVRIAGATVRIVETGATTTASSTGVYEFTLPAGTYTPEACATGYQCASPGARTVTANADVWGSVRLSPSQQQQTGVLRGYVADAAGNGYDLRIAGATVRLVETHQTTTSDANGHYTFTLPPGNYTAEGSKAGYITGRATNGTRTVVSGGEAWGSMRLQPEASVKGTVTGFVYGVNTSDANDRSRRLAGAAVSLGSASTTSAADGSFSFADVAEGGYTLAAALDGYQPASLSVNVPGGGSVSAELGLNVVAAPDLTAPAVTITEPAAGALVRATPVTVRGTLDDPTVAQVSVNGAAVTVTSQAFVTQVALTAGAQTVVVTARDAAGNEGRAEVQVTYEPPETEGVTGYVYAAASAARIEGALVSLGEGYTATTSATGEYAIEAPAGSYTLTVTAAGYKVKTQALTISAQARARAVVGLELQPQDGGPGGGDPGGGDPGGGDPGTGAEYLRIDGPADNAVLEDAEAVVSGTVRLQGLYRVAVNDVDAVVVDGAFSAAVPLVAGENRLTARAWGSGERMLETFIRVHHAGSTTTPPPATGCGCGGGASGAEALFGMLFAFVARRRARG
jgi:hypothetical protein